MPESSCMKLSNMETISRDRKQMSCCLRVEGAVKGEGIISQGNFWVGVDLS